MMEFQQGYLITDARCSGCDFRAIFRNGKMRRKLNVFEPLKENLFQIAKLKHDESNYECNGGHLMIAYTSAVTIKVDPK